MKYNEHCVYSFVKQKFFYRCIAVILCWLIGLLLGSYAANKAVEVIPHLLNLSPTSQIPILGMLLLIVAPFAATAFLDHNHTRFLILVIIFIKAIIYSFCLSAMMIAFNEASWLARCLFMFSSSCTSVFLLFFWLEGARNCKINQRQLFSYLAISAFLVIVDYYVISPFAVVFY